MPRQKYTEHLPIPLARDCIIIRAFELFVLCFINTPSSILLFTFSRAVWKLSVSEETEMKIDFYREELTIQSLIVSKNLKISLFLFGPGASTID